MRLRFWLRDAGSCLLGAGAIAVLLPLFSGLSADISGLSADWTPENLLAIVPAYFLLAAGLVTAITMIAGYRCGLPLSLAMGSTRREGFWGLQLLKFLPSLAALLAAGCVYALFFPELLGLLWTIAAAAFALAALGDMAAIASYHWGTLGAVVTVILLVAVGGAGGGSASLAFAGGAGRLLDLLAGLDPPAAALLAAAAALVAADLALERRMLRQFEVRM